MASLVVLAVSWWERLCRVSIRIVSVAVDLSVMLNVAAGQGTSFVNGGSIGERERIIKWRIRQRNERSSLIRFMTF